MKLNKKEIVEKFMSTNTGQAVSKINNAFFDIEPISKKKITKLALKYYGYK